MISNAFGTAIPMAGSWNCIAVAARTAVQAKVVEDFFHFPEDDRCDREIAGRRESSLP